MNQCFSYYILLVRSPHPQTKNNPTKLIFMITTQFSDIFSPEFSTYNVKRVLSKATNSKGVEVVDYEALELELSVYDKGTTVKRFNKETSRKALVIHAYSENRELEDGDLLAFRDNIYTMHFSRTIHDHSFFIGFSDV